MQIKPTPTDQRVSSFKGSGEVLLLDFSELKELQEFTERQTKIIGN